MKEVILLTGSTGFLGSYLLEELLSSKYPKVGSIVALSRGSTQKEAERRTLRALYAHMPKGNLRKTKQLLKIVKGDVTKRKLGLSDHIYQDLIKKVTSIYHNAALCEFKIPLSIIRNVNVQGTKNLLDFALTCQKNNDRFSSVHHISTVAVAGNKNSIFYEKDLDVGQRFNNTYEQSKFEAEKLIRGYRKKGLPITVYRAAIIVGDSKTGYTSNFKMFYQPLHFFSLELFKEIPANEKTCYSFVPVDCVAKAISLISFDDKSDKKTTYHIVNPNNVTLEKIINVASKYFGFKKPHFVKEKKFPMQNLTPLQLSLIEPFIPYFNYRVHFDSKNSQAILVRENFKWPKINTTFLKKLLKFCVKCGFIKIKGKK